LGEGVGEIGFSVVKGTVEWEPGNEGKMVSVLRRDFGRKRASWLTILQALKVVQEVQDHPP